MTAFLRLVAVVGVMVLFFVGCASAPPLLPSGRPDPLAGYSDSYSYFVVPANMYWDNEKPIVVLLESKGGHFISIPNTPVVVLGRAQSGDFVFHSDKMSELVDIRINQETRSVSLALKSMGCSFIYPAISTDTYIVVSGIAGRVWRLMLNVFPTEVDGDSVCAQKKQAIIESWKSAMQKIEPMEVK